MKVTKQDLKKALAKPWKAKTCLLNQTLIRYGEKTSTYPSLNPKIKDTGFAVTLQLLFDNAHRRHEPSSESLTRLAFLYVLLPVEI